MAVDGDIGDTAVFESMCGQPDFAGSQEQHAAVFELAEDTAGEVDRDVADTDLAAGDARLSAALAAWKFFKQAIEYRAGALGSLSTGIGILHLPQDLGFADHLRVEPRRDSRGVL